MLTKTDLSQIQKIVQVETKKIVQEEVGIIVDERLDKKLKPIKKDLRYLKKTVNLIAKNYDEGDMRLERRVKRIEQHLHLPAEA